jgi:AraC family transcriptional regulator
MRGRPFGGHVGLSGSFYTRGDVDILPAGWSDLWEEDDASTSLVVRFSPSVLHRAAEDMGVDPDRAGLEPRHQFRDPQIEHIAWALDAERRAGHPSGRLYTESLGMALAAHLLGRHAASPKLRGGGLAKSQLRRVTTFIEEHIDENLPLARLAGVTKVSASHLKTLFRRSTGLPVHEYVVQRRVERAKALLVRGELPASQVALEAGFAHQSHMARWMRRILGVTPTSVVRGESRTVDADS